MQSTELDRLRRLALGGDVEAATRWLAGLARRGGWLDPDLSPRQASRLAEGLVRAAVDLGTLRNALDLAHAHSVRFAVVATQLRHAIASGSGRQWFCFPKGVVWHSVEQGSSVTLCGCEIERKPPQYLALLPDGELVCRRCRAKLAELVAVEGRET